MKDYLSIEKGISEIIHKLNKLKKTAKDVCVNISIRKRGKTKRKARTNKNLASKGNQYSNVYKSASNLSFNLEPSNNKTNKANKANKSNNKSNNKANNKSIVNESIEISEPFEGQPESLGSTTSTGSVETGYEPIKQ